MSLSRTFHALSNETRHEILRLLKGGELTAGQIAGHFAMTAPSVSHHLSVLKQADLVSARRSGQEIIYSLNLSAFEEAADAVAHFLRRDHR